VELALTFVPGPDTAAFERNGFARWRQERMVVASSGRPANAPAAPTALTGDAAGVVDFDAKRDLESVVAIHSGYSASRSGTLVRDKTAWQVSLVLAGNPDENFRVALRDGRPVAYLRSTNLVGAPTVLEMARLDDAADALAALVVDAVELCGPGIVLPAFDDLSLTVALEHAGLSCAPSVLEAAMLSCLDAGALGRRLDVTRLPGEDAPTFLARILPQDAFVFWPADRF